MPGVGEVPRSQVWLSFGDGTRPTKPFTLKNFVARSALPGSDVLGSSSGRGGDALSRLPATGGDQRWALLALALLVGAVILRRTASRH